MNVALKIMNAIMSKLLSLRKDISDGMDHYFDDILVDKSVVETDEVFNHLRKYVLDPNLPKRVEEAEILGLEIESRDGMLIWRRGAVNLNVDNVRTKREFITQHVGGFDLVRVI